MLDFASIRASTLGCRCPLDLIEEFDAEMLVALRSCSNMAALNFADIEFTLGAPLEGVSAGLGKAIRTQEIRLVAFCFRARLRRSLAFALESLGLPVDGAYFRPDRGADFVGEQIVDTLLAACIRRLGFRVAAGESLPPPATRAQIARAHWPYVGIASDLLERGASLRLIQVVGGDYYPMKPGQFRKSKWADEPRDALLRAWPSYATQVAGFGLPAEFIHLLATASAPSVRAQLSRRSVGPASLPNDKASALLCELAIRFPEIDGGARARDCSYAESMVRSEPRSC
ncbi:MAG: hypothetical protein RR412_05165 [Burkholderiaceae bacterium]